MLLNRFPFLLLFVFSSTVLLAQKKVSVAFTIKEKDLIPEGIAYDATDQSFYVSSIHKHKVVKISSNGVVRDFISSGQDGVGEVLGMKVDSKRHLWFCSVSPKGSAIIPAVFEYDIASGKLIRKYELNTPGETQQLNDLQFLNDAVYVTDSFEGAVYKIEGDKIELFVKSDLFRYSNGITTTPNGQKLLVSTGSGIVQLDPATKNATRIPAPFYIIGVDGLYNYKNSLIAIQNVTFPTSISQFNLSSDLKIESANLLAVNHPLFDIPTTGVIVGDWFYFISNSQLEQLADGDGKIKSPEKLKDVVILKIPLR